MKRVSDCPPAALSRRFSPDAIAETCMNDPNQTGGTASAPSLNVISQYIRDLSFENPRGASQIIRPDQPPALGVQVNVNAKPLSDTDFEVDLVIEARGNQPDGSVLFNIELQYSGIFRVSGIPREQVHPVVLIECPRLLFPFARQIIADTVRNGGFPPLLLDPVDFATLYRQRLQEQASAQNPN
jgi:preprotein translocase subunit SecB